jgi:Adenine-specific methyltransferase EcoRI
VASKALNRSFQEAKKAREDEFYTQLPDIERELRHYKKHFKGKVVYGNCDDPRVSNFFHYFSYNFEKLGLKKLITTCYKSQNADLFSQHDSEQAIHLEYDGDRNGNNVPDPEEIGIEPLKGDGDFRSAESIELLKQADIVVTNPPFSLFREYVAQLIEYDKKFLIIGSLNAITYNDIFKLIRANKLWLGYGFQAGNAYFAVPDAGDYARGVYDEATGLVKFRNVAWFTNLDISKRHEDLILYKTYSPDEYPTYDNYDAIEVAKVADIPCDYDGVMGVPLTFLDKHNPDQFEILGLSGNDDYPMTKKYGKKERVVDGVHMKSNTGTLRAVIRTDSFGPGTYFDVGYPVKGVYRRLFIRRKNG